MKLSFETDGFAWHWRGCRYGDPDNAWEIMHRFAKCTEIEKYYDDTKALLYIGPQKIMHTFFKWHSLPPPASELSNLGIVMYHSVSSRIILANR